LEPEEPETASRELLAAWDCFAVHSNRHKKITPQLVSFAPFARDLLKLWSAPWTFTEIDGVEPTSNVAERALRGPVIHRKLSLGRQSERGERTIERLLSASVTCRLQGRSLFAYLADVLGALVRGDPALLA
jgi:Transposase IS66 family